VALPAAELVPGDVIALQGGDEVPADARLLTLRGLLIDEAPLTGDGVNDAPALKQADIGVAMGITGTAAAKEAADVVLTDDNFASIAAAVEEGRRVYDNLVKALAFVLPTNIGLALILLVAVAAFPLVNGEPLLPMRPVQILWINLVAAVASALPLAFEAPEIEIARGVSHPVALREAQTMAATTVILFQVCYLLNCRSLRASFLAIGLLSNPYIWLGIGVVLLLQLGFVYLPPMHLLFGSAPLVPDALLQSLLVALLVLPVVGAEKGWSRRGATPRAPCGPGGWVT
jgi:Ca2+-transporting ATPase